MMKATLKKEHTESYTFSPVFYSKSREVSRNKPSTTTVETFEEKRLRKLKESEDAMKEIANKKKINPHSEKLLKKRAELGNKNNSVRQKSKEENFESKKINEKSQSLLAKKYKKDIMLLFNYLDSENSEYICFDDIKKAVLSCHVPINHEVSTSSSAEIIWNLLDHSNKGYITFPDFFEICKLTQSKAVKDDKSVFRDFVNTTIQHLKAEIVPPKSPDHIHRDNPKFIPRIGQKSADIAKRLKQKELQVLEMSFRQEAGSMDETAQIMTGSILEETPITTMKLSMYDHMMLRKKLALDKIESRRKDLEMEEKRQTTFQPTLFTRGHKSSRAPTHADESSYIDSKDEYDNMSYNSRQDSVFERLYAEKDKRDSVAAGVPSADTVTQNDLEECTFQPSIPTFSPEILKTSKLPSGFYENISRIRESYTNKKKSQEEKEKSLFSFDNERYMRSRRIAAMGPSPFTFKESKMGKKTNKIPRFNIIIITITIILHYSRLFCF